jgi:rhamnose utilization protein RhaD (predicted bifunctional aldolase and dehydrogenase)/NAD(P)-dependent dehydrogenase (short-subunit alcohol dehydrogenase family)
MLNHWNWSDAEEASPAVECAKAARLLGLEPDLVLFGGGNASVKASWREFDGRTVAAVLVTPSGMDLAAVEVDLLVPLEQDRLRRLVALPELSDTHMRSELGLARLSSGDRGPSVESLLHAVIPAAFVLHTHSDAILTLTNSTGARPRIVEVLGDSPTIVDYRMPGFTLARHVSGLLSEGWPACGALVLMHHGLVTFGPSARAAYDLHIELVSRAEAYLAVEARPAPLRHAGRATPSATDIADLRRRVSASAGRPMVATRTDGDEIRRLFERPGMLDALQRGPLTPDHVIRTKRTALVGRDVEAFASAYEDYFAANRGRRGGDLEMLDPAPRVILDKTLGLITAGPTATDALIARDIFLHTARAVEAAELLGGYEALPAGDIFDMEYWDLEQAKLAPARVARRPMDGWVAVVTGAASGIGRACVEALLGSGAAVVGLDIAESVVDVSGSAAYVGLECDASSPERMTAAASLAAERFGGLDILVISAGIFGQSQPIAEMDLDSWRRTITVNLEGVLVALRAAHSLLALAPGGGRVVLIASKNVPAPGPGAAAYSASKAGATQLARVAALEWAKDGIRVNAVHPDAVFDTGLWTPALLEERAAKYGMSVADYKRRNLLRTEVTSATVAELVVQLCSSPFACTTGAQIPIDGGSDRVI